MSLNIKDIIKLVNLSYDIPSDQVNLDNDTIDTNDTNDTIDTNDTNDTSIIHIVDVSGSTGSIYMEEKSILHRPKRKMRQTFYKKIKILLFSFLIV